MSHALSIPWVMAAAAQQQGSPFQLLIMMGATVAIMWFLMINPQRKQMKQHREMLGALKKGDDVVTTGGLMGRVHAIADKVVTLEVASGVRVQVLKQSVQGKVAEEPVAAPAGDKKEEK